MWPTWTGEMLRSGETLATESLRNQQMNSDRSVGTHLLFWRASGSIVLMFERIVLASWARGLGSCNDTLVVSNGR